MNPITAAELPETPTRRARKRPENTPHGCRALAADDLVRAAATTGEQPRLRLEHSAAVWGARADILDSLEAKYQARVAAGKGR